MNPMPEMSGHAKSLALSGPVTTVRHVCIYFVRLHRCMETIEAVPLDSTHALCTGYTGSDHAQCEKRAPTYIEVFGMQEAPDRSAPCPNVHSPRIHELM